MSQIFVGQTSVGTHYGKGIPGEVVDNDFHLLDYQPLVEGEFVTAGDFVWPGSDPAHTCIAGTSASGVVSLPVVATPASGTSTTGSLVYTADGTNDISVAFAPGTYTSSSATPTAAGGTLSLTVTDFTDGVISIGGQNVIRVSTEDGTTTAALIGDGALNFRLGVLTVTAPTQSETAVGMTLEFALNESAAAGSPLGIVMRSRREQNYAVGLSIQATLKVTDYATVVRKGTMTIYSQTDAEYGQKVFARESDGKPITGTAGETIAGAVETDWYVREGDRANRPIIVSNW